MTRIPSWLDVAKIYKATVEVVVVGAPCGAIQIRTGLDAKNDFAAWNWRVLYRHEATPNPHPFPSMNFLDTNHPETITYQSWENQERDRVRAEVAEVIKAHAATH